MVEEFNVVLEHLRDFRKSLDDTNKEVHLIRDDLKSLKSHMTGFLTHENVQDEEIAMLKARVTRV